MRFQKHLRSRFQILLQKIAFFTLLLAFLGCGYTLRGAYSPILEKEGIRRIFVASIVNNSYKSGVENQVYNALLKKIVDQPSIQIVRSPEDADAVLQGVVDIAEYAMAAPTTGDQLSRSPGVQVDFSKIQVASVYQSKLVCSFRLMRRNPPEGRRATVWSASFQRTLPFPGANQLGPLGTTSALINESEFDRSLSEMAQAMSSDVRESILNRF